jgi:hypothetical protein
MVLCADMQVIASRSYDVVPVVEGLYDMGNLAAVCRSADGKHQAQPGSVQSSIAAQLAAGSVQTWWSKSRVVFGASWGL